MKGTYKSSHRRNLASRLVGRRVGTWVGKWSSRWERAPMCCKGWTMIVCIYVWPSRLASQSLPRRRAWLDSKIKYLAAGDLQTALRMWYKSMFVSSTTWRSSAQKSDFKSTQKTTLNRKMYDKRLLSWAQSRLPKKTGKCGNFEEEKNSGGSTQIPLLL